MKSNDLGFLKFDQKFEIDLLWYIYNIYHIYRLAFNETYDYYEND